MLNFCSGFGGSSRNEDLHDVCNTLYSEMSLSSVQYSQTNSLEMPAGHMYEVVTSAVEGRAIHTKFPYHLVHSMTEVIEIKDYLNILHFFYFQYLHIHVCFVPVFRCIMTYT